MWKGNLVKASANTNTKLGFLWVYQEYMPWHNLTNEREKPLFSPRNSLLPPFSITKFDLPHKYVFLSLWMEQKSRVGYQEIKDITTVISMPGLTTHKSGGVEGFFF